MKKTNFFALFVYCLFLISPLKAQTDSWVIAITDFTNLTGSSEHDYLTTAIPNILITDLVLCEKLTIVERSKLNDIYDELGLGLSGAIDENQASEIGKIVGAKEILTGSVIKVDDQYRVDSRLVNVETGEIRLTEKHIWETDDDIILAIDKLAEKIVFKLTGSNLLEIPEPKEYTFTTNNTIAFETNLENDYRHPDSKEPIYFKIDLYSCDMPTNDRIPLNISLVLDVSGSMIIENKINYVKQAAAFVVNNLKPMDYISLVSYSNTASVLIPATHIENSDEILNKILQLKAGGSTNISSGMNAGYNEVIKNQVPGQVNRVLLLSDGLANRGVTESEFLEEICQENNNAGISTSTFGVGLDFNEDLMLCMANTGNGNYYFINDNKEISNLFSNELDGLLAVTAQNVRLLVTPAKGVEIEDVSNYYYKKQNEQCEIRIGDIFSNEHKSILVKMSPPRKNQTQIANVILFYDDAIGTKQQIRQSVDLTIKYSKDEELVVNHRNPKVQQEISLYTFTNKFEKSIDMVEKGQVDVAMQILDESLNDIAYNPNVAQNLPMKRQILSASEYIETVNTINASSIRTSSSFKNNQKRAKFDAYINSSRKEVKKRTEKDTTRFKPPKPQPVPIIDNSIHHYNSQETKTITPKKTKTSSYTPPSTPTQPPATKKKPVTKETKPKQTETVKKPAPKPKPAPPKPKPVPEKEVKKTSVKKQEPAKTKTKTETKKKTDTKKKPTTSSKTKTVEGKN